MAHRWGARTLGNPSGGTLLGPEPHLWHTAGVRAPRPTPAVAHCWGSGSRTTTRPRPDPDCRPEPLSIVTVRLESHARILVCEAERLVAFIDTDSEARAAWQAMPPQPRGDR